MMRSRSGFRRQHVWKAATTGMQTDASSSCDKYGNLTRRAPVVYHVWLHGFVACLVYGFILLLVCSAALAQA